MSFQLEDLKDKFPKIPPEDRKEAIQFVLGQCLMRELAEGMEEVLNDDEFAELAAHLETLILERPTDEN